MSKYKIFVDGAVGTTGLRIHERLSQADDIELLTLPEEQRKDLNARVAKVAEADLTFLCLPDEASKELVANAPENTRICDTSTAHRVNPNWVYGFPELSGQREKSKMPSVLRCRVAMPRAILRWFVHWWKRDSARRLPFKLSFLNRLFRRWQSDDC